MANPFTFKIVGLAELTRRYSQAPDLVEPILKQGLDKAKVAIDAQRINPRNIPWRTGELARRWTTVFGNLSLKTKPDVEYARAVEYGMPSSPGRFVPGLGRDGKGRRLVNGANIGMWPGFKGRHFMENILSASKPDVQEIFKNALTVIRDKMSGNA